MSASGRRRALAAVAAWLVAVVAAGWLSWRAIESAGDQVVAPVTASQPRTTSDPLPSDGPTPTVPTGTRPPATATAAPSSSSSRTVSTEGGTAAARCAAGAPTIEYATPALGWRVEVEPQGAGEVRVRFRSDDRRVRILFTCLDGAVEAVVEDDRQGSGSGRDGSDD